MKSAIATEISVLIKEAGCVVERDAKSIMKKKWMSSKATVMPITLRIHLSKLQIKMRFTISAISLTF
jgi:hypothetical protein